VHLRRNKENRGRGREERERERGREECKVCEMIQCHVLFKALGRERERGQEYTCICNEDLNGWGERERERERVDEGEICKGENVVGEGEVERGDAEVTGDNGVRVRGSRTTYSFSLFNPSLFHMVHKFIDH
jgi:hypothetical protein